MKKEKRRKEKREKKIREWRAGKIPARQSYKEENMENALEHAIEKCQKIVDTGKKTYAFPLQNGDISAEFGMELTKCGVEEYEEYLGLFKELENLRKNIPVSCGKCTNWDNRKFICKHPAGLRGEVFAKDFCSYGTAKKI